MKLPGLYTHWFHGICRNYSTYIFLRVQNGYVIQASLFSSLFFIAITVKEPLGMWDWVRKYRCGRQWLSLGFLWLGGPLWLARLESKRQEEARPANVPRDPSHQTAATFQRQEERERESERERETKPNTIFSQRGTRAQHSWHCHRPSNNPYSILCVLGEWMAAVCETLTGPVCPAKGEQPTLPAHSEPPDPARPSVPRPAKPNTHMSEAALLSHRTGPTAAENTQPPPPRGPRRANIWSMWERPERGWMCRSGGGRGGKGGGMQGRLEIKGSHHCINRTF